MTGERCRERRPETQRLRLTGLGRDGVDKGIPYTTKRMLSSVGSSALLVSVARRCPGTNIYVPSRGVCL